jgi:hypothetical protein
MVQTQNFQLQFTKSHSRTIKKFIQSFSGKADLKAAYFIEIGQLSFGAAI